MSERKAINKYYPPDFDPSKVVKKRRKVKTGSASLPTIRLMTPFSMKCDNCGDYISKSRKFNARKETTSETYLGMKIVRFHIKCPRCASEILFRTDPKSANFVIEFGAKKNYDSENTNQNWKDETVEQILDKLEKEEEEEKSKEAKKDKKSTSLEELEKKMNDLRRQQELSDEIDEIREKNKKLNESLVNSNLQNEYELRIQESENEIQKLQEEEDDKLVEEIFNRKKNNENTNQKQDNLQEKSHKTVSDSDSEYEQPVFEPVKKAAIPTKIYLTKKKKTDLGVSFKRVKR